MSRLTKLIYTTDLLPTWLENALQTYPPSDPSFLTHGLIASVIFFLGLLLIHRLPKYKWTLASALIILITPLVLSGFWFSEGTRGISDWDYYFSLHTTHRWAILNYHVLPHWNPYTCGGTAGLADPEFRFFTPTFLLQLILGVEKGFPAAIYLATATGALGMLALGKKIRLSIYAALLAAIIFAFGSVNLLEIVEGHPNIFAAMYIPWIFWAWLGAYRHRPLFQKTGCLWLFAAAFFLTLTFFQGGIYLLMYTALAFITLPLLTRHRLHAYTVSLASGLLALSLSAIKLIPVILWLKQFQDQTYASSINILPHLKTILTGRITHTTLEILPGQGSGWHEYGAYIGVLPLILAMLPIYMLLKNKFYPNPNLTKDRPSPTIIRALLASVLLTITLATSGPLLKPMFDQVSFLPRSNISRVIMFAVLALSLLAGYGLDYIRSKHRILNYASLAIVALVTINLFTLVAPLSHQAFVLPAVIPQVSPAPQPIAYTAHNYKYRYKDSHYTRAYDALRQGYGSLVYCSVLSPRPAVQTIHDEGGSELIHIGKTNQKTSFNLISWSPNKVVIETNIPHESEIVLNTNYAKGWRVNNQPAQEIGDRVGFKDLSPGFQTITFEYKTPGFTLGLIISLITVIALIPLALHQHITKKSLPKEKSV